MALAAADIDPHVLEAREHEGIARETEAGDVKRGGELLVERGALLGFGEDAQLHDLTLPVRKWSEPGAAEATPGSSRGGLDLFSCVGPMPLVRSGAAFFHRGVRSGSFARGAVHHVGDAGAGVIGEFLDERVGADPVRFGDGGEALT